MFRPEAPIEEIEQDVEAVIMDLVTELDLMAQDDPVPEGADDRAYVQAFSDARANSDRDQVSLLSTAVVRPHLAHSLIYLNRRMDQEDLDPGQPAGIIGVIVRLAMDGLWVSDILDHTRFSDEQRHRITDILTGLTYLSDARLEALLAEVAPRGRSGSTGVGPDEDEGLGPA